MLNIVAFIGGLFMKLCGIKETKPVPDFAPSTGHKYSNYEGYEADTLLRNNSEHYEGQ